MMARPLYVLLWLSTAALAAGCGGAEKADPEPTPTPAEAPAKPATPDDPGLTAADLKSSAEKVALVPSPVETQRALEQAGIETSLATMIPTHDFDMENTDVDHAAIRSGVVLADALLTVKTAEKKDLLIRLSRLQKGLAQLGGGRDIDHTLTDMKDRIKADAVTREELLKEFDDLSGAAIPELNFNDQDQVVPFIQAGSWLEGANLVAKAVKEKKTPAAADTLLKQPAVVDYFRSYVTVQGGKHAPAVVTKKLDESLVALKALAEKTEPFTAEDIESIIKVTDDVLALL